MFDDISAWYKIKLRFFKNKTYSKEASKPLKKIEANRLLETLPFNWAIDTHFLSSVQNLNSIFWCIT